MFCRVLGIGSCATIVYEGRVSLSVYCCCGPGFLLRTTAPGKKRMLTAFLPASAVCALLARVTNPELSHSAVLSWPRCSSGSVQPYFVRHNNTRTQFRQGSRRVYSTGKQGGPRKSSAGAAGKKMFGKMTQESLGRACGVGAATGIAGTVHCLVLYSLFRHSNVQVQAHTKYNENKSRSFW